MILSYKKLNLFFTFIAAANLFLFLSFSSSCASQKNDSSPQAANTIAAENPNTPDSRVSLIDDQVSFVPPADFKVLTADRLNKKLPDNDFPKHIFSNSDQTGLVFVYFDDVDLKPEDLPEVKKFVEGNHRNYSNWITSEITEMNGNKWFHFEWEEPSMGDSALVAPVPPDGETPVPLPDRSLSHYREYATSLNNKLLRFVFQADVKKFSQLKDVFTESIKTIKIKN